MNKIDQIIGISNATKKLRETVQRLSRSIKNVLIIGEAGLGKGTAALQIHLLSKLSEKKPFVTINSRVTGDTELKAILFRENLKAQRAMLGKPIPELVRGSTLLMEEIEEMSFLNQARVARFLDEQKLRHGGRVIITVKDEPDKLYREQKISKELFPLLASFEHIVISPLRERAEDIPHLVRYFLEQACSEMGNVEKVIDVNTLDFLTKQQWKENVRELKSVIDNAVLTTEGNALVLPDALLNEYVHLEGIINNIKSKRVFSLDNALENLEKLLLQRALSYFGFHQSKAAATLGITEPTLRYKMRKLGIPPSRKR